MPVKEPGAVILLEVETETPLEIEAVFHRDFQLEWPAALGATYIGWDSGLKAFAFGEEQRKFAAIVGSPTAENAQEEFQTNYSESQENSFRLGVHCEGQRRRQVDCDCGIDDWTRGCRERVSQAFFRLQRNVARVGGVLPQLSRANGERGAARQSDCSRRTTGRESAWCRGW